MTINDEQRTQVRIPVDEEIFVRDVLSGKELGTLANLHAEGFMLISDGGLKEDHLYQVVLEKELGSAPTACSLGAECLWISETGTGDQVWAGFQIMECSDSAQAQIEEIMAEHK